MLLSSKRLKVLIYGAYIRLTETVRPLRRILNGDRTLYLEARLKSNFKRSHFDSEHYLVNNPDLQGVGDLYLHFLTKGLAEGRPARFFDADWYSATYRDVSQLGLPAKHHFDTFGYTERREACYINLAQDASERRRNNYRDWLKLYEPRVGKEQAEHRISALKYRPKISIIMPVYNPPIQYFKEAIASVTSQIYENWELCIADDCSTKEEIRSEIKRVSFEDPRIKFVFRERNGHISRASNSAIDIATGEYFALLDHDDSLSPDALLEVAEALNKNERAKIIYSDEDKLDELGRRYDPYFKPDFNYELFLAQNMISHLGVYSAQIVRDLGGFRAGYEGSQDHDLALRVMERCGPGEIIHIPKVLYHWRAITGSTALNVSEKNYAADAGVRAVRDHLQRRDARASVDIYHSENGQYRVRYDLPADSPLVSIIIPTRDRIELLRACIESILSLSTYPNFEVLILDNDSVEPETKSYFESIEDGRVNIIKCPGQFNYSSINNVGVDKAKGDFVILLNNDIVVISHDWIEEMLSFASQPGVGCVGARLWYPDDTLQHAGIITGLGGIAGHVHKHFARDDKGYFCRAVHHQEFSAVTGACLMVRKSTFLNVGGLDEQLAVAFNDVDFCLRVKAQGYRNIWTPYAEMYHYESASRGDDLSPEKKRRFKQETDFMEERWGNILENDPFYNKNLTLKFEDCSLSWPPR